MAGKGSRRRGSTPEETKRYHEGWERVFGSAETTKPAIPKKARKLK